MIDLSVCLSGFSLGIYIGAFAALVNFTIWLVFHLMQS